MIWKTVCIGLCKSFGAYQRTWNWNIVCISASDGLHPSPEVSHPPRRHPGIHHRTHCALPGRLTGNTFGTFWMYLSVDPYHQSPPPFHQSSQPNLQAQVLAQFQGVVPVPVQGCLCSRRFPHCLQYLQELPLQQPQDFPPTAGVSQLLQPAPQPHPGELI